jgi:hypothetical protein
LTVIQRKLTLSVKKLPSHATAVFLLVFVGENSTILEKENMDFVHQNCILLKVASRPESRYREEAIHDRNICCYPTVCDANFRNVPAKEVNRNKDGRIKFQRSASTLKRHFEEQRFQRECGSSNRISFSRVLNVLSPFESIQT